MHTSYVTMLCVCLVCRNVLHASYVAMCVLYAYLICTSMHTYV